MRYTCRTPEQSRRKRGGRLGRNNQTNAGGRSNRRFQHVSGDTNTERKANAVKCEKMQNPKSDSIYIKGNTRDFSPKRKCQRMHIRNPGWL